MSQSNATLAEVQTARSIIAEAIEAYRAATTTERYISDTDRRWAALSSGQKAAVGRLLGIWGRDKGSSTPFDRFLAFVMDGVYGSPVSFPEPTPAVEMQVAERVEIAREIAREIIRARSSTPEQRLARWYVRVEGMLSDIVTVALEVERKWRDRGESTDNLVKMSARAWARMTEDEQADFAAWCSAIDYRPGEVNYGPLALDEMFDVFVIECLEGTPIFPLTSPTDPGPDGTPAYAQEIPPYVQERFKGGFQLVPALSLAPLVVTFHGVGHPFHQADTRSTKVWSDPETIEIMGVLYRVEATPDGIILSKSNGEAHYVLPGPDGHECSCPDHFYRRRICKHLLALRSVGLIPDRIQETPMSPTDNESTETAAQRVAALTPAQRERVLVKLVESVMTQGHTRDVPDILNEAALLARFEVYDADHAWTELEDRARAAAGH